MTDSARRLVLRRLGGAVPVLTLVACAGPRVIAPVAPVPDAPPAPAPVLPPVQGPPPAPTPTAPPLPVPVQVKPLKIGLALGGGAARGFAHIGVIKVLESADVPIDVVIGTSAGSVVGALYASGMNGYQLQEVGLAMDEAIFADWVLGGRGMFRGEALQKWINDQVRNRPLEKLRRPFGVTSTALATGEGVVFRTGNTGLAVRASSAVPGVFAPVMIGKKEYVDGGLFSPVPVRATREAGADFVIAVDISADPTTQPTDTISDLLLQTFAIMGRSINRFEAVEADLLVRPAVRGSGADFSTRHAAILAGERAMSAALPLLKERLAAKAAQSG
jgi:NTE family protein